ncbi:anti-sigma factor [Catenulispora subtropica]|uniref:Anti-sigma K factor RskA C-terminal domain-containing protein n=1 Tax=Catenulispora subtropica TaxID=450798 RepID=A0ABN2QQ35_9ACTN
MVEEEQQEQVSVEQTPLKADGEAVTGAARWRAFAERQARAFHVLALTCIVFGAAAAAFAWTTIRVHDRQAAAENKERDVAQVLAAADVESAREQAVGGGIVTAHYSPALGRAVVVEHGMHTPTGGRTYVLWYLDGSGAFRSAGSSRFDHPVNDLVLVSVPATTRLQITLESSGKAAHPTTPPLAVLPLG